MCSSTVRGLKEKLRRKVPGPGGREGEEEQRREKLQINKRNGGICFQWWLCSENIFFFSINKNFGEISVNAKRFNEVIESQKIKWLLISKYYNLFTVKKISKSSNTHRHSLDQGKKNPERQSGIFSYQGRRVLLFHLCPLAFWQLTLDWMVFKSETQWDMCH